MPKTILITGATDGIGLEATKMLASEGHHLLLHGRNRQKLEAIKNSLAPGSDQIELYVADLSNKEDVEAMADAVTAKHKSLDVLINNAGVLRTTDPITKNGLDVRFVVNTIAPYYLTMKLLPILGKDGRVINIASASQAPVNLNALSGKVQLSESAAYAQSKLAIIMWTRHLSDTLKGKGPVFVSVNPGSLLGSKMVKEAFGIKGGDIRIGGKILKHAALSEEFAHASGKYFDNDSGQFAPPHPDANNPEKNAELVQAIEILLY